MDDPSPIFDGKGAVVWVARNGAIINEGVIVTPPTATENLKALIARRAARIAPTDEVGALSLRLDNLEI